MRRLGVLGTLALTAGSLFWPFAARAADAPTKATVSMKEFAFMPATITVRQGGTVTWTYDESPTDPMPNCETVVLQTPLPVNCPGHSTTAVDKGADGKPLWDSGVHRADGFPYTVTFSKPGTYHYICVVHGGANANNPLTHMEGDVIVEAAPAATTPAAPPTPTKVQAASSTRGALAATGGTSQWPMLGTALFVIALAACGFRRRLA